MGDHDTLDILADPLAQLRVRPNPDDQRLTVNLAGIDHTGTAVETRVPVEQSLTLFLNGQEIVTAMTIGDYPEDLAVGYFLNQGMLRPDDTITGIDYDEELSVIVVRTARKTDYEEKLRKKTQTSGCAQGTAFGDLMDVIEGTQLPAGELRTSWLYRLSQTINTIPSLYLEAGAIHGAVLCRQDEPLIYMEDVGRHNAVDKIAGYMHRHGITGGDKIFYTTGRLTSEMIIKTVRMGIPDPGVAFRLHRLGRGAGAERRPDADRPGARQAFRRAVRARAHRVRSEPGFRARGEPAASAQGGGR